MPQVLKDEVRARIEAAALEIFAERGYAGAKMTAIAERAGVGTASTYRYYAGKRELFDALVTPALAEEFESLLDRRVRALSRVFRAETTRGADDLGDELLRFWAAHRLAVVILLDRAEGTDYAAFGARFVERLVASTLGELRSRRRATEAVRFVLARIFDNTRRMLAAILEAHADERALREAIDAFWSYQIPGLRGFAGWAGGRPGDGTTGARARLPIRRVRRGRARRPRAR
jgi:AcrR family transcriptional regulator